MAHQPIEILEDITPLQQASVSLFRAFPPQQMQSEREADGFDYLGENPLDRPDAHDQPRCPDPAAEVVAKRAGSGPYQHVVSHLHFSLLSGVDCAQVGDLASPDLRDARLREIALNRIRLGGSWTVARAISSGDAWIRDLTDGDPDDPLAMTKAYDLIDDATGMAATPFCLPSYTEPDTSPVSMRVALSLIEEAIPELTTGRAVIYVPARCATPLVADDLVVKQGIKHYTAGMGTEVVFDGGFMGLDPSTGNPSATAGNTWWYVRGAPILRRGGDWSAVDADPTSGYRERYNDRQMWVEEDFTIGFAPMAGLAQEVVVWS